MWRLIDDEWQLANELYDYYQKIGYTCELLSRKKCLELYPYLRPSYPVGALFFPQELSVDSPVLMQRLLGYCKEQMFFTRKSQLRKKLLLWRLRKKTLDPLT